MRLEGSCVPSPFGVKTDRRKVGFPRSSGLRFSDDFAPAKDLRVLCLPRITFGKPLLAQNVARHWLEESAGEPIRHYSPLCSEKCRIRSLLTTHTGLYELWGRISAFSRCGFDPLVSGNFSKTLRPKQFNSRPFTNTASPLSDQTNRR